MSTEKAPWWRGERGEWYVVVQGLLFLLLIFGPRSAPGLASWPTSLATPAIYLGAVLMAAGVLLFLFGVFSLGRNLTPLPHPMEDAVLVETGAYRLVRHPMYGGVVIAALGWGLGCRSFLTLCYAALVFIFLYIKSRREERLLKSKFPRYSDYSKRVRRFIPFIY